MAIVWLMFPFLKTCVLGEPHVPCYFIFRDSLVDSGNNNHLKKTAKVDYLPYGIDFWYGPTGRFCNGRTAADITGELLGFDDFIPPFLNASGSKILKGVNYASGSAGILIGNRKIHGMDTNDKVMVKFPGKIFFKSGNDCLAPIWFDVSVGWNASQNK